MFPEKDCDWSFLCTRTFGNFFARGRAMIFKPDFYGLKYGFGDIIKIDEELDYVVLASDGLYS